MVTQEQLDGFASRIESGVSNIRTEVEALKAQIEGGVETNSLDTSKLEAAVSDLESVEAPAASTATSDQPTDTTADPAATGDSTSGSDVSSL